MKVYYYVFGFETPEQAKANKLHGWDDEDSRAVFVLANNPEEALNWGREISEHYIKWLDSSSVSWKLQTFASWIDNEFEVNDPQLESRNIVSVGEIPDFNQWG